MTTRFRWLNAALVVAAAGAAVGSYYGLRHTAAAAAQPLRTVTAKRGVVLSTVSATGNVAAPAQLNLNFQTAGHLTELNARQGQRVKKGQLLARLDATEASIAVQTAEANLRSAQAHLQQLLDGETPAERAQDAFAVKQAQVALANAKTALRQTNEGNATSLATSGLSLKQATAQLNRDKTQLGTDTDALATGQAAMTKAQSDYDAATNAVAAAKQQLANDEAALAAAQTAQTQHQGSAAQNNSQLSRDQSALSQAKADLQAAQQVAEQACVPDPTAQACLDAQATVANKQKAVNDAQGAVDSDQSQASSDSSTSTNDALAVAAASRAVSADQTTLGDAQSAQQTAKSDLTTAQNDVTTAENAITADKAKIVTDQDQQATQRVALRSTTQKNAQALTTSRQSVRTAQLAKTSAVLTKSVKQQPANTGDLAAARASVVSAQASLETARQTLSETELRAPVSGTVAAVSGEVGQDVTGGGTSSGDSSSSSSSNATSPLITLVHLGGLEVTAGFSETDAAKVKVGQTATISLDALPNVKLAAHVIAVDPLSTVVSNVVTYNVTFALDRRDARVKPGMSADVEVIAAERDGVVNVPTSAIRALGGGAGVTVLAAGKQTPVSVVTGLKGDSTTEIVSGLSAGQTVVLPTANLGSGASLPSGLSGLGSRGGGGGVFFGPAK